MCQKGRALQLSAAAGSPQETRSRRGRSECPLALLEFSVHTGVGMGGHLAVSSLSTRPDRCLGTVSDEKYRWENPPIPAAEVFLGAGGALEGGKPKL